MRTWLLAVVAVTLLSGASRAADPAILETIGGAWTKTSKLARWLEGRVLGCLVRDGMTEKQVRLLLGEQRGPGPYPSSSLNACGIHTFWRYDDYALFVTFFTAVGSKEPARVARVTFRPLDFD